METTIRNRRTRRTKTRPSPSLIIEPNHEEPIFLCWDLLCGAGGFTTGAETARVNGMKAARVIVGVNHDENAIKSHSAEHPHTFHFIEDIRKLDLTAAIEHTRIQLELYPNATLVCFAGVDCTHHSKARGGGPRDADSRTLAQHIFRYVDEVKKALGRGFDIILIENVEEFMSWGPLDEKGRPLSRKKGHDYVRWCNKMQERGYRYDYRLLNAADFGAFTSRKRYFGAFVRPGLPMKFPQPTHAKKPTPGSGLKKWNAVKEVLDFNDQGKSIFTRKKSLSPKTLERIYAGLIKYVAQGDTSFIQKYYSGRPMGKVNSVESPASTVTTFGNQTLVQTAFLSKYFSGPPMSQNISVDQPSGAITTIDHHALVQPAFLTKYYSGDPAGKIGSIEDPSATLRTKDALSLIQPLFMLKYNSTDSKGKHTPPPLDQPSPVVSTQGRLGLIQGAFLSYYYGTTQLSSLDSPAGTITTKDRISQIQYFITRDFTNSGYIRSIDDPAGALLSNPKHNLVEAVPWVMSSHFDNAGRSIEEPAPTQTANRKWDYLMFPQWGVRCSHSTDKPAPTLLARMDKMSPYLLVAEETNEPIAIAVFDTDCEAMLKIKQFMAAFGIVDIKMRMLRIKELKKITGFREDYTLIGTQSDQKKFIGNAVVVDMARALVESFAAGLLPEPQTELFAA